MEKMMIVCSILLFGCLIGTAQDAKDLAKIEALVQNFSSAGDRQDAPELDKILHPQFRAVVHRLFDSPELSLMDKALYLQLMKDKKIGGDQRAAYVLQTDLEGNIAHVKAVFEGKTLRFTTFISLVKLENGEWQIVDDMPKIEKV